MFSSARSPTAVLSLITVALGVTLILRTVLAGGGPLASGVILGVLFSALGLGRLSTLITRRVGKPEEL